MPRCESSKSFIVLAHYHMTRPLGKFWIQYSTNIASHWEVYRYKIYTCYWTITNNRCSYDPFHLFSAEMTHWLSIAFGTFKGKGCILAREMGRVRRMKHLLCQTERSAIQHTGHLCSIQISESMFNFWVFFSDLEKQ